MGAPPEGDAVVAKQQERGGGHAEGDGGGERVGGGGVEHVFADAKGDEHEGELAALGEREGEEVAVVGGEAEGVAEGEQDEEFDREQAGDEGEHRHGVGGDESEVDARADRDEEEAQEEALEGFEVGFELVAVFAVGEDHAREERAQRGGQADELHQQGDADDEAEGGGGEHLPQFRARDVAEEGAQGVASADDDQRRPRRA